MEHIYSDKHFKRQTIQLSRFKPFLQDCYDHLVTTATGVNTASKYTGSFQPWHTSSRSEQIMSVNAALRETLSLPSTLRKWRLPFFPYSFSQLDILLQPWEASSPNTKISFNKPKFKQM